jgi:hypothetical protein
MVILQLTDKEAEYMKDILDLWIEEYKDTKDDIVTDRAIDSVEELLLATQGSNIAIEEAEHIRDRLVRVMTSSPQGLVKGFPNGST